jgi:hypothetical protein
MIPGARATSRRISLATLLVAFVCALATLPSVHLAASGTTGHAHSAAVVHQQAQLVHRSAEPDLTVTADVPDATVAAVDAAVRPLGTDSSHTVDSTRTRGPPAQADHQPALSL